MDLAAIRAWLEENKGQADVVAFLQGLSAPNQDAVKKWMDTTAEGKAFITAEKDKHFNKSLETWKSNHLQPLIDAEVKKLNPDKTPEMIEIEKLRKTLEEKDNAEKRQVLLNKALQVAAEKKLPIKLIERFLGDDEEKTIANLAELETELNTIVQTKVDETFKGNGYQPGSGGQGAGGGSLDIAKIVAENQIRQN